MDNNRINNCISTYKDKDKLIVVVYIYIDPKKDKTDMAVYFNKCINVFEDKFDETIKCIVFPVLKPEMQKIELLNATKVDTLLLEKLLNTYKDFTDKLEIYCMENQ